MSLVNLYKFDNNTNDSVGSNDGTLAGSSNPTIARGKYDLSSGYSAYEFSPGDNDRTLGNYPRIELGETDFQYTTETDFSIVIDLLINNTGDCNPFTYNNSGATGSLIFFYDQSEGQIKVQAITSAPVILQAACTANIGEWQQVALVYEESTQTINCYSDGVLAQSVTYGSIATNNFYAATGRVQIGCAYDSRGSGDNVYFRDLKGKVGRLWNYDHALSAIEVRSLYNQTKLTRS